mmetsp:Transcript_18227/g.25728  ORF Transcript_18227/g.25728 Transcript_18227/m.25728 type:complete len:132 (-) Transcript_18227:1623-2018(-)
MRYNNLDNVTLVAREEGKDLLEREEYFVFFSTLNNEGIGKGNYIKDLLEKEKYSMAEMGLLTTWDPLYLVSMAQQSNSPTLQQAMASEGADSWFRAMESEIDSLLKMKVWEEVPRSVAKNMLDSTWAFKKK